MSIIGKRAKLTVVKHVDFGIYLDGGELGELLLPFQQVPGGTEVGDELDVFVHLDSEDRPIATTQVAKAEVGELAYLKVEETNKFGAFLDWGLDKDVLVPFSEQRTRMQAGRHYLVYLYLNPADGRITATTKYNRFMDKDKPPYREHEAVSLIIANQTDLGRNVIIDHKYTGLIHASDISERLNYGEHKSGAVKRVRADGKLDVLLKSDKKTRDAHGLVIEQYLMQQPDGFAPIHDKSSPDEISKLFGFSKGAFKRAIGSLMKEGIITISKDGISLVK